MARGLTKGQKKIRRNIMTTENSSTSQRNSSPAIPTAGALTIPSPLLSSTPSSSSSFDNSTANNPSSVTPLPEMPMTPMETSNDQLNDNPGNADIQTFIEEQRAFNQRMLQLFENGRGQTQATQRKAPLPLKLTEAVRGAYKSFETAASVEENVNLWDFSKSFSSEQNSAVNYDIMKNVLSTEKKYSTALITAATRTYFKSRKRRNSLEKNNKSLEYRKSARARSRMNTKRLQRQKVLKDSTTYSEEEKKRILPALSKGFISSDESMSDDPSETEKTDAESDGEDVKAKVLVKKKLTWRSRELNDLMAKLDKRINRRKSAKGHSMTMKRREGPMSSRQAPIDAPEWTIKS